MCTENSGRRPGPVRGQAQRAESFVMVFLMGALGYNWTANASLSTETREAERANPVHPQVSGIWIGAAELRALPAEGEAWTNLMAAAEQDCGRPMLSDQDQQNNVCIMAKALVSARTGDAAFRQDVIAAIRWIADQTTYDGRALALGRELAAYVIAADLIRLAELDPELDGRFRARLRRLLVAPTSGGPINLIDCHESRPNNWGTHCGASRVAVAAYLGDRAELERAAQVFKGYLGDRSAYDGFDYGSDLSWQCQASDPMAVNPEGCIKNGRPIGGVLPDDQRRGGNFSWPPPKENYVYEALQGALTQAVLLRRQGYDPFSWSDRALFRAFKWLHEVARFPAEGDDLWQPHIINYYYGTNFPALVPTRPGKNVGWTDWTHSAAAALTRIP